MAELGRSRRISNPASPAATTCTACHARKPTNSQLSGGLAPASSASVAPASSVSSVGQDLQLPRHAVHVALARGHRLADLLQALAELHQLVGARGEVVGQADQRLRAEDGDVHGAADSPFSV